MAQSQLQPHLFPTGTPNDSWAFENGILTFEINSLRVTRLAVRPHFHDVALKSVKGKFAFTYWDCVMLREASTATGEASRFLLHCWPKALSKPIPECNTNFLHQRPDITPVYYLKDTNKFADLNTALASLNLTLVYAASFGVSTHLPLTMSCNSMGRKGETVGTVSALSAQTFIKRLPHLTARFLFSCKSQTCDPSQMCIHLLRARDILRSQVSDPFSNMRPCVSNMAQGLHTAEVVVPTVADYLGDFLWFSQDEDGTETSTSYLSRDVARNLCQITMQAPDKKMQSVNIKVSMISYKDNFLLD